MQLFMVEAPIPPGYLESYVLEIRAGSEEPPVSSQGESETGLEGGSAFIWLLRKNAGYQAEPLLTRFDFVHPRESNWILADLDDRPENGEEIAIYFSSLEGERDLNPPVVFSLATGDPVELPFLPSQAIFSVGMDFDDYWAVQADPEGRPLLEFQAQVYPSCPVDIKLAYRWNGLYYEQVSEQIQFAELPDALGMCEPLIDLAVKYWGENAAADLMETLLPSWPPEENSEGEPYPADALDGWKYRLGIYRALSGEGETAVQLMNEISTDPVVPTSSWIDPAQRFLAAYQKPEDIYRACLTAVYCDPATALELLASQIPSSQDALQYLREWGVEPISSGYYDFDDDDETERWFTVRNAPRSMLDFWILVKGGGYFHPVMPGVVESRIPPIDPIDDAYIDDDGQNYQPATMLDGTIAFTMRRFPDTEAPYLVPVPLRKEYPSRFFVPLESYREGLLSGTSPELIQEQLEALEEQPGLLCKPTWSCDEYYYLLGLAGELAKDEESAVNAYQRLWLDYSKSPFTTLARLKLEPLQEPIPTPDTHAGRPTHPGAGADGDPNTDDSSTADCHRPNPDPDCDRHAADANTARLGDNDGDAYHHWHPTDCNPDRDGHSPYGNSYTDRDGDTYRYDPCLP